MDIIRLNEENGFMNTLCEYIKNKNIIPIIGAGFTKGCKNATNRKVPDSKELKQILIDEIINADSTLTQGSILEECKSFDSVSSLFNSTVSRDKRNNLLKNYFTGVVLENEKKEFLSIKWKSLYTVNIDDAIEKNSNYTPLYPLGKLSNNYVDGTYVYKLHGDVHNQIAYQDEMIIFSREQYLESLNKNSSMLEWFKADYNDYNIFIIGCSLDDELDLHYTLIADEIKNSSTDKIYVTHKVPSNIKQKKLSDRFHVNKILIIDDYLQFYHLLYKLSQSFKYIEDQVKSLLNPSVFMADSGDNVKYLTGINTYKVANGYKIPNFTIKRDLQDVINKHINANTKNLIVIRGKALSGKTLFALKLAESIRTKNVYYFDSKYSVKESIINDLINQKDTVIILDSNCVPFFSLPTIETKIDILNKNQSHVVVLVDNSDKLLLSVLTENVQHKPFELDNKFSYNEIKQLNSNLDKLGLPKFNESLNIISNIQILAENMNVKSTVTEQYELADVDHVLIIFLILSQDKLYTEYMMRHFDSQKLNQFFDKYKRLIEFDEVKDFEYFHNSRRKVVVDCKICLIALLNKYMKYKKSVRNLTERLVRFCEINKKLSGFSHIQTELLLFDNMNEYLSRGSQGGAEIIQNIYAGLEYVLYNDLHYWLQRSKSILHSPVSRVEENKIRDAYKYVLKTYIDSQGDPSLRKVYIAALTTKAMIAGRLANIMKYSSEELYDAIDGYFEVYDNREYINRVYLDKINDYRRYSNDFHDMCNYIMRNNINSLDRGRQEKARYLIDTVFKNR